MAKTVVDLDTLKINYLTQAQYNEAALNDEIEEDEIYLTPSSGPGHDVPSGGSAGQVLTKDSNDDYDLAWTTVSSGVSRLVVEFQEESGVYTSSHTAEEIYEAYNDGLIITCRNADSSEIYELNAVEYYSGGDYYFASFTYLSFNPGWNTITRKLLEIEYRDPVNDVALYVSNSTYLTLDTLPIYNGGVS